MLWAVYLPHRVEVQNCRVMLGAPYKEFRRLLLHLRNTRHQLQLMLRNQLGGIMNTQEGHFESCNNSYKNKFLGPFEISLSSETPQKPLNHNLLVSKSNNYYYV